MSAGQTHLPGTSYGLLRFTYSVVPDITVHQELTARFKIPDTPDHAAVILMTDDKAKMGPLIILNRHILILRRDRLACSRVNVPSGRDSSGDKTLWSMCFSFSAPPERGVFIMV
jgi:hypothetical protein